MKTHASSKSVPSFYLLILKTIDLIKKSWLNLLMSFCILILITAAASLILYLAYFAILYCNFIISSLRNVLIFRISWGILIFFIFYLIAAFAQILIIKSLLDSKNFQLILKSVTDHLLNYVCLAVIISVLFIFFSLPIYSALLLFYTEQWLLGFLSVLLGYVLIIVLTCLVIFSPVILLEQNQYPLNALTKSYMLSRKYFSQIIWRVFLLSILMLIINAIASMANDVAYIGLLLRLIIALFGGLLFFAFPVVLYKNLSV